MPESKSCPHTKSASAYRPRSLTPLLRKTAERVVDEFIKDDSTNTSTTFLLKTLKQIVDDIINDL